MKKIIKYITIIAIVLVSLIVLDTLSAVAFNNSTIIHKTYQELDEDSWVDKGLIIDTYYCTKETDIIEVSHHIKGHKFSCPVDNIEEQVGEYKIIDKVLEESMMCAEALELFYQDEEYSYYFSCMKSSNIIVKYNDGIEIPVKQALKENKITIKDLDRFNIAYYKEKK